LKALKENESHQYINPREKKKQINQARFSHMTIKLSTAQESQENYPSIIPNESSESSKKLGKLASGSYKLQKSQPFPK